MGNNQNKWDKENSHPYVKPPERGQRVLPACIEQVNKFDSEVLPKIEAIISEKKENYKEDLKKINEIKFSHKQRNNIWYDDQKNDRPLLDSRTKQEIMSTILGGNERFKLIAGIELLAGLIGKYKSKSKGNDDAKCGAFEELSQKLHYHNFFVKNPLP